MGIIDKIYIQEGLPNVYGINQDEGTKGMHTYIRKDALLESLANYEDTDRISIATLLNKINSL